MGMGRAAYRKGVRRGRGRIVATGEEKKTEGGHGRELLHASTNHGKHLGLECQKAGATNRAVAAITVGPPIPDTREVGISLLQHLPIWDRRIALSE